MAKHGPGEWSVLAFGCTSGLRRAGECKVSLSFSTDRAAGAQSNCVHVLTGTALLSDTLHTSEGNDALFSLHCF